MKQQGRQDKVTSHFTARKSPPDDPVAGKTRAASKKQQEEAQREPTDGGW